jgi:tetratricopeptide (TPR) repeat protein
VGGAALAECLTYFALHCIRLGRLAEANTAAVRALHLYDTLGILSQYRAGDPIMTLLLLALVQGDYDQALTLGEQARRQAEQHNQPAALSFACYGLANALLAQGKLTQARTYAEQGLILSNSLEDRWFSSLIHEVLGQIASTQEELQAAKGHFEIAYTIREEFDEPGGMAETLIHLGEVAMAENEPGVAQQHYERSLALYREINDRGGRAAATKGLGDVARSQGHYRLAETYYQQALQSALEMRYMSLVFNLLLASANLFVQTDRRQIAVELLAFVHNHPASDFTRKEQARQTLERLGEYPAQALEEITWQAAPPQWAAILHSV